MQELRLLAHLSQEPVFLKALKEGKDLHAYSASLLYNIPYLDFFELDKKGNIKTKLDGEPIFIKEMKKKYRDVAKTTTFGLLYGMGPKKLASKLHITIEEAIKLIKKYFTTFPKVGELMDKLVASVMKNKYALSPLDKRKMFFYDIDWYDGGIVAHCKNQAKNFPFQGCGASTTKLALIYIKEQIKSRKLDAKILFAVHDDHYFVVYKPS